MNASGSNMWLALQQPLGGTCPGLSLLSGWPQTARMPAGLPPPQLLHSGVSLQARKTVGLKGSVQAVLSGLCGYGTERGSRAGLQPAGRRRRRRQQQPRAALSRLLAALHGQPGALPRGRIHHPLLLCVHKLKALGGAALRRGQAAAAAAARVRCMRWVSCRCWCCCWCGRLRADARLAASRREAAGSRPAESSIRRGGVSPPGWSAGQTPPSPPPAARHTAAVE